MDRQFTIRLDYATLEEVWAFAEQVESATGLVIYWQITSYCPSLVWLNGMIL